MVYSLGMYFWILVLLLIWWTMTFYADDMQQKIRTKRSKHLQVTKMAAVFSTLSIKIIYIKVNYFACDLYAHMGLDNFFMHIINK
jgi:hypothetical protein